MDTITNLLLGLITLLLGAVGFFVKKIMDDTAKLKEELKPLGPALIEIQGKFTQAGHQLLFPLTVAPGSPLHVTDYGDKLLKESGFYELLKNHHDSLVQLVKDKAPKSNYDIQQAAFEVVESLLESDDEMALKLKEYAFNDGLDLQVLAKPGGIALRDEVMKELKF